jgi:hypothetical protein
MNLTVASVFVRGEYGYTAEYVDRLYRMVRRWIDRPFRAACLTDQPEAMPEGVEPIVVEKLPGFAPWTKLELFNPARAWAGRVLYLDLDSLIVAPLAPLVDTAAAFAITADPPKPGQKDRDSFGHAIVRRFNSSVMVWDGGTQTDLYTGFTRDVVDRLSGDQDYIGTKRLGATAWSREWFPRISELGGSPPQPPARVVFCKVPKNHIAAVRWPWVAEAWQ